jgi:nuclear pore complex protein Nup133
MATRSSTPYPPFALLALKTVFQAVKGTPTCYIFSCPQDDDHSSPPFHCLVPYGSSREPGLILVSLSGTIRLWGSIGIGLAGGDNYSTIQLNLSPSEQITNLVRADVCLINSHSVHAKFLSYRLEHTLLRRHPVICFVLLSPPPLGIII